MNSFISTINSHWRAQPHQHGVSLTWCIFSSTATVAVVVAVVLQAQHQEQHRAKRDRQATEATHQHTHTHFPFTRTTMPPTMERARVGNPTSQESHEKDLLCRSPSHLSKQATMSSTEAQDQRTVSLDLSLRPVTEGDKAEQLLPLLDQLSTVGHVTDEFFQYVCSVTTTHHSARRHPTCKQ